MIPVRIEAPFLSADQPAKGISVATKTTPGLSDPTSPSFLKGYDEGIIQIAEFINPKNHEPYGSSLPLPVLEFGAREPTTKVCLGTKDSTRASWSRPAVSKQ